MATEAKKQLKLFYCYAREDKVLRDELDNHLSLLKRQHQITSWSDREIIPGTNWEKEIDTQLNSAHIILLLVSASFLPSVPSHFRCAQFLYTNFEINTT